MLRKNSTCSKEEDLSLSRTLSNLLVLGFKLSLQKTEIIPMGGIEDVNRVTSLFGCKVGKLPTFYPGLSLGALHK